jgi:hypothetical protein
MPKPETSKSLIAIHRASPALFGRIVPEFLPLCFDWHAQVVLPI